MKRLSVRLGLVIGGMLVLSFIAAWFILRLISNLPMDLSVQDDALRSARLSIFIVLGFIIIIGAGVWITRNLTAPLEDLAEFARAVGRHDLSRRVKPTGSQEMIEVGKAFNQMVTDLEKSEELRRNLVSDVSHELRHPLTVMQGTLRAMLDGIYPLEKAEIARVYEQTRQLSQLVNDLHELSMADAKQLPLQLEDTDVVTVIRSIGEVFEPVLALEGIELHFDLPEYLPPARVDRTRITQVLYNLLTNAIHYTPSGGVIAVHASQVGEEIRLAVEDTGQGLDPEHLPFVFDRFYRADKTRDRENGNAGLGLAIVKAIVEAHGGRVEAWSPGLKLGAIFSIFLPAIVRAS